MTPDPGLLYLSPAHREALATIIYGVETRKGFLVCTGEVGTGKTTVIRAFFDQARADAFKLIYVFTPQVSPLEMATHICRELGMDDPESVFTAVPRLQMKLLETFENGRTVVLMIDEAQLLPPETLEFLRLLSNFETDTEKLIQIVLVGQPELDELLARRDMRQVAQRVALRARLRLLSFEEGLEYVEHRLLESGANDIGQVMSPSTAWLIVEASGGIPRVINILADNVLIAGFGAGQRPVGSRLADTTIREFVARSGAAQPTRRPRFAGGRRRARVLRQDRAAQAFELPVTPREARQSGGSRAWPPDRSSTRTGRPIPPVRWQAARPSPACSTRATAARPRSRNSCRARSEVQRNRHFRGSIAAGYASLTRPTTASPRPSD